MKEYLCSHCGKWAERYRGGIQCYYACAYCGERTPIKDAQSREKPTWYERHYPYGEKTSKRNRALLSELPGGYIGRPALEAQYVGRVKRVGCLMRWGVRAGLVKEYSRNAWFIYPRAECPSGQ